MKINKFFLLSLSLIFLLAISLTTAHNGDDNTTDQPGSTIPDMNVNNHGLYGNSEYMDIAAEISVNDYILVSLSVLPSEEMQNIMQENMDDEEISEMYQYMNKMDVKIFRLVEFIDVDNNGYSADDTEVSEYILNNETLKQPTLAISSDMVSYEIESDNSSIFKMTLDVYSEDQMPFRMKWSYNISYPFTQFNTTLAIIHEVESMNQNMFNEGMNSEMGNGGIDGHSGDYMDGHRDSTTDDHSSGMMMDDHEDFAMVFSWDDTAVVDGIEKNVTSTDFEDNFILSIPQGSNIFYDPQVSMDLDTMSNVDMDIASMMPGYLNYSIILAIIAFCFTALIIIAVSKYDVNKIVEST